MPTTETTSPIWAYTDELTAAIDHECRRLWNAATAQGLQPIRKIQPRFVTSEHGASTWMISLDLARMDDDTPPHTVFAEARYLGTCFELAHALVANVARRREGEVAA